MREMRPRVRDLSYEEFLLAYPRIAGADGEEDPAAPAVATIEPVSNPGPWDADIRQFASDQSAYEALDRYMREHQQPYVSRLEEENAAARELYTDLANDPEQALLALTEAVYEGDTDKVSAISQALGLNLEEEPTVSETTPAEPVITPEMQEAIDFARESKMRDAYNQAVEWAQGEYGEGFDPDFFHPHMVIKEGDAAEALESYKSWDAAVRARYAPPAEPAPKEQAPPVLGSEGAANPTATLDLPKTMDEAFDAMFANMARAREQG